MLLPKPVISSTLAIAGTYGILLNYQITATNYPTSYGASGLPSGLTINPNTGAISGYPGAYGTLDVTASGTNAGEQARQHW